MTPNHNELPFWNLTYNDPGRWREVERICGSRVTAWQGILKSLRGNPVGSPRAALFACSGDNKLVALIETHSDKRTLNLEQTTKGAIAYFKVRLELYGIPFRRGEWVGCEQQPKTDDSPPTFDLKFQREGEEHIFQISAPQSTIDALKRWLNNCLGDPAPHSQLK